MISDCGMGIADLKARSRSDGSAKQVHPTTMMITKYLSDQPYWRKNDPTYESDNQPTSPLNTTKLMLTLLKTI